MPARPLLFSVPPMQRHTPRGVCTGCTGDVRVRGQPCLRPRFGSVCWIRPLRIPTTWSLLEGALIVNGKKSLASPPAPRRLSARAPSPLICEPICQPVPRHIVAPLGTRIFIGTSRTPVLAILMRDVRLPRPDGLCPPSDLAWEIMASVLFGESGHGVF